MFVRPAGEPSYLRPRSQDVEIVAGDFIAGNTHHSLMPAQYRMRIAIDPGHPAERGISLAKILKGGIRRSQQPSAHPLVMANLIQVLWVAHFQRVQQGRLQDSEYDYVFPDAQRQSD